LYNIRMIIASGKRLENIVNDILDFSRMKHHDLRLSLHRVDMYDVTQFVLSIVRPLVGSKSLVIENRIEPEKIIVSGDDGRLQQILMNLVGNAVKFSESGTVQVSAVMNESDQKAVITVTDTGIGIPSDQHDQIFEPFHQGDGSVARSHGGTGLGLAVTKKLIELHGGKIWFDSKPGSGSSFSFSLVLYDGTADQSASAKEIEGREKLRSMTFDAVTSSPAGHLMRLKSESGAAGRAKILVVDDEPINILIVINHLLMEGYEVSTAENGEQVDEFFSRGDIPDLILLDVMLPRISGFDVCRRIREKFPSHELPIIMLTARQTTRDIVAGISAGANDYLIKPVSGEELLARVGNLISMKNSVKLQGELKIIKNELTLAMELQKSIFPSSVPVLPGIGFAARFVPSSHVSGDFYDYHVRDLENIDIIVADIAGHGIPAAMIASMMQMAYGSLKKKNNTPSENLSEINAIMNVYPDGVYLTACCVHIDIAGRRMRFSSAGHPPVLVYRKSENTVLSFSVFGRPIGMFEDAVYTTDEISLEPGDRIVLYTDGITEAWNPDHVAYGEERFKSLILDNVRMDVEAFSDRVVDAVTSWSMVTSGRGLSDDVTFLVVDFIG
ncbi:MAG TPA: SpoIIE family protein phosphatase, partial [Spirochaetota bacterium]